VAQGKTGSKVRAEAAKVVDAVVSHGRSLDTALAAAATFANPADRALLKNLCYGTVRFHWKIRGWQDALLERPLRSRDSIIQSLISVGLYQLTDTRIPDHAAVSMTVEATRSLRQTKFRGLVNAILRNFQRNNIQQSEPSGDEARYSHPTWLIDQLKLDWPDHWRAILEANNERAPMWLRVNRRHYQSADYLLRLNDATGEQHSLLPGIDSAIRLASPRPVTDLPGFEAGDVSVQDAAAQLAAIWLKGGSRILDACAAPGGKTGHLLELAGANATLTAVESDKDRLPRITENLERLGLHATLVHADASNPVTWWDGQSFDRILLDAPCSASGVIRRHPDIKVLRRKSDIAGMAALQHRLLEALWPLLKAGGKLLYVTCSVLSEENERVVAKFLQESNDAQVDGVLPNNNIRDLMQDRTVGYQILPGTSGVDGFYFACLEKQP